MKEFYLQRNEDVTGNSGTGKVAEGAIFENGVVVVAWLPKDDLPGATNMYHSIGEVEKLHGHEGKTVIVYQSPCIDNQLSEKDASTGL